MPRKKNPTPRRGRPPTDGTTREHAVTMRLTEPEHAALVEVAAREKRHPSQLARLIIAADARIARAIRSGS